MKIEGYRDYVRGEEFDAEYENRELVRGWDYRAAPSASVETTRNPDGTYTHKVAPAPFLERIDFGAEGRAVSGWASWPDPCQWEPREDRMARGLDGDHAGADFLVGAKPPVRLCASCADLPRFRDLHRQALRPATDRREVEG